MSGRRQGEKRKRIISPTTTTKSRRSGEPGDQVLQDISTVPSTSSQNQEDHVNEISTEKANLETEEFLKISGGTSSSNETSGTPEETWTNKIEYLLALIGFTVGVGSIWRFPIVCARNGGGAFILPFVSLMMIIGGPLYYLEICLGQFTGKGPSRAFEFCPLLKGIGYLMVTMVTFITWYYQTVMAWIVYYSYQSFRQVLPWSTCDNWWNTISCKVIGERNYTSNDTGSDSLYNITSRNTEVNLSTSVSLSVGPAMEFWEHNVLRSTKMLEDFGDVQFHLSISLLLSWVIVLACLYRGVKSLGKVVYFTALFPYVLLTILLVRGVTLDGSIDGLLFFCRPTFSKLLEAQVWLDASLQVFYSLGPIWGGVITMSAHNKFHQTVIREALIVCIVAAFTALYAGLVIFSVLGFMAKEAGVPIQALALASGHGLAFVVYPTAVSLMPVPQLWAVMFFFMMLLVILDTLFGNVEIINSTVAEFLPKTLKQYKITINTGVGIVLFSAGQLFLTQGGIHLFQLMDWYVTAFAPLIGAFIEATMIAHIYGADRFALDIEMMTGKQMSRATRILICIVIPIFALVTFFMSLFGHKPVTYADGTKYEPWAIAAGLFVGLLPIFVMCSVNILELRSSKGTFFERIKQSLCPSDKWKPNEKSLVTEYQRQTYIYERTFLQRFRRNLRGKPGTPYF